MWRTPELAPGRENALELLMHVAGRIGHTSAACLSDVLAVEIMPAEECAAAVDAKLRPILAAAPSRRGKRRAVG
jgi:hypothetical protein